MTASRGPWHGRHRVWGLALLLVLALAGLAGAWWAWRTAVVTPPKVAYVGSQACAACHAQAYTDWQGSHHQQAMQPATPGTVLAPFRGERFAGEGIHAVFSQREGRFYVQTEGVDGTLQSFEVSHTLGLTPLQQYLIPMPHGGLQAFTIAWDTRPQAQGGQRWFQLQADMPARPGDPLHWTGRQNNWNFMCAECHVTQFQKNFDADKRTYNSRWAEMAVGCEACHGPGSRHVGGAANTGAAWQGDPQKGLVQPFGDRRGIHWTRNPQTGNAIRSQPPAATRDEVELCARCHAHRSQISDGYVHGKPLLDTHRPSLLAPGLFWPDGQMKAEVYNHASFQQSRMYQHGVTCSDCHNPHSQKLRRPGNGTCLQCHAAERFDAQQHHHHPMGSAGAACTACHMPTTTYMQVDPRHDHGLRVPRPDLSTATGSPDACTRCHAGKPAGWAAGQARRWYPALGQRQPPVTQATAPDAWRQVVADTSQSSIVRATALARLASVLDPRHSAVLAGYLSDPDALVRLTAVDALSDAEAGQRGPWLKPLLADPVRSVRIAAARWLAALPSQAWPVQDQDRLKTALDEYIAVQRFNADRPEAYNNLGMLHADQRDWPRAEAALATAMALAPDLVASGLNLAEVYRLQGREDDAQALIRQAIARQPGQAAAHHALGLSLLRQRQYAQALASLEKASQLDPGDPRLAYVYATLRDQMDPAGRRRR